MAGSRTGYWRR